MNKLFFFDEMITPKIITFIYWIFLLAAIISGVGIMLHGSFIMGVISLIGGLIFARIWCELLIVLFKIHENLKKIADRTNN